MFDAVILAGGLGTRLRSVVSDVPKCMAPVGGRPFLEWILAWIEPFRPGKIILSLGYLSDVVTEWVRNNMKDLRTARISQRQFRSSFKRNVQTTFQFDCLHVC